MALLDLKSRFFLLYSWTWSFTCFVECYFWSIDMAALSHREKQVDTRYHVGILFLTDSNQFSDTSNPGRKFSRDMMQIDPVSLVVSQSADCRQRN